MVQFLIDKGDRSLVLLHFSVVRSAMKSVLLLFCYELIGSFLCLLLFKEMQHGAVLSVIHPLLDILKTSCGGQLLPFHTSSKVQEALCPLLSEGWCLMTFLFLQQHNTSTLCALCSGI